MKRKHISRRRFVGDVATGLSFTIVPRHVLGRGFVAPSVVSASMTEASRWAQLTNRR